MKTLTEIALVLVLFGALFILFFLFKLISNIIGYQDTVLMAVSLILVWLIRIEVKSK